MNDALNESVLPNAAAAAVRFGQHFTFLKLRKSMLANHLRTRYDNAALLVAYADFAHQPRQREIVRLLLQERGLTTQGTPLSLAWCDRTQLDRFDPVEANQW